MGRVKRLYSDYKKVRPEKVEEIKAVWDSPNFKTNNTRLVYLFRHCKSAEYGYTIREFAYAKFPDKMTSGYEEAEAFKLVHQMFRRFRHDEENHEVFLAAMLEKLKGEGVYRHYYFNIIDDDKAIEEVKLRAERCALGLERAKQELLGIGEMSKEDWEILHERYTN